MDEIGAINDGSSAGVSISQRRPSRAERAIDDPIREMEGMFVDEYGRYGAFFMSPGATLPLLFPSSSYVISMSVPLYSWCFIPLNIFICIAV